MAKYPGALNHNSYLLFPAILLFARHLLVIGLNQHLMPLPLTAATPVPCYEHVVCFLSVLGSKTCFKEIKYIILKSNN